MNYPLVRGWLAEHTALEPSLLEGPGFDSLVGERVLAVGGGSESAYIEALDRSADELDRLAAGVAVPETWFFRYPESFKVLIAFLRRRRESGAATLRMRSIGCASGEEPYSMAMAALHAGWPAGSVSIEGIDCSRRALERAERAEYGAFSIRGEVPAWAVEFLRRDGEVITVDPAVRSLVRFVRADAVGQEDLLGGAACDVVFCRNLIIYLSAAARARLVPSLAASLSPGGLLFVGHAEPLLCGAAALRSLAAPHAFVLERVTGEVVPEALPPRPRSVTPRAFVHPPAPPARPPAAHRVETAAEPTPEPTLENARDLADAGRMRESEAMIRAVIARRGPSAAALELLGTLRMASNDLSGAKVFFEQAVYLEPASVASLLQLAMLSEHRGDSRRAAVLWDRVKRASAARVEERPG